MQTNKIKNIKYLGRQQTIDISVKNKHHLFYGNGIITSNSHSYAYSFTTFLTAVAKAHFPKRFFRSYLNHAYNKQKPLEEIKNLVLDSKSFQVDICNPDLRLQNTEFIEKDGRIYFGLQYIKDVGEKACDDLLKAINHLDD